MSERKAYPDSWGHPHWTELEARQADLRRAKMEVEDVVRREVPRVHIGDLEAALRAIGVEGLRKYVAAHDAVEKARKP